MSSYKHKMSTAWPTGQEEFADPFSCLN